MEPAALEERLEALLAKNQVWAQLLEDEGYDNFGAIFRREGATLRDRFDTLQGRKRHFALLSYQGAFSGGMGSVNDLPYSEAMCRVRAELRELLDVLLVATASP